MDRLWRWLARRLPRRLVRFAAIRMGEEVHVCVFGDVPLPEMNLLQAIRAWDGHAEEAPDDRRA